MYTIVIYICSTTQIIELYMNAVFSYVLDANEDGQEKPEDDALN